MSDRVTVESVKNWVEDFGLTHEPHPMDDDPAYDWALLVRGQAFATLVARRRADFNYLSIQVSLGIADEHRAAWIALDPHNRRSFLYDLQLALHTQSIGHMIEFESDGPDGVRCPGRVMIGANLTEEPIRRADWFGRNHIVQSGARIVALMFQKLAHQRRWP